ncbi:MAG: hypothetical protein ACLPUT_09975 [Solirubrobacteraceae bacterium]
MSSRIPAVRPKTFIGTSAAAIVLLALAAAPAAGAATTIYACVSKKSGAMRIVSAKAKCRHGERKLSWSSTGPAGPAGAPGAPGAAGVPGANGVGADYSSFSFGPDALGASETGDIVVSKTIPAGTYFVSGKTVVGGLKGKSAVFVVVICELVDSSSTPRLMEPTEAIDIGEWVQQLSEQSVTEWEGAATMEMQGQLTTTEPTTLALVCDPIEGTKEATIDAFASQVSALQTTANK